jgi:hypothetical protein
MMDEPRRTGWTALAMIIGSALLGTTAAAAPMSIRALGAEQLRVESIGYRLAAASSNACARPQMLSGLVVHDLGEYPERARAAMSIAFSLHHGIGILGIVPGSVADDAGLQVDDEIIALNGRSVEDPAVDRAPPSYLRLGRFVAMLEGSLELGPADLLVRRRGTLIHVLLRGRSSCGGDALLVDSSSLNAWSDGSRVYVSSAMLRLARTDDELAFVLAHEMAHNILGHSSQSSSRGLLGLFGLDAFKIRRQEADADLYAVPLMRTGGYSPSAAVTMLEKVRGALGWTLSIDHPALSERMRAVSAEIARQAVLPRPAFVAASAAATR